MVQNAAVSLVSGQWCNNHYITKRSTTFSWEQIRFLAPLSFRWKKRDSRCWFVWLIKPVGSVLGTVHKNETLLWFQTLKIPDVLCPDFIFTSNVSPMYHHLVIVQLWWKLKQSHLMIKNQSEIHCHIQEVLTFMLMEKSLWGRYGSNGNSFGLIIYTQAGGY